MHSSAAVGFGALLVLVIWQTWLALSDVMTSRRDRLPLRIMLVLLILYFGENTEIERW